MQPNQLTLNVDYLNNGTTTAETYDRFDSFQNRSVYVGEGHSAESRDTLTLYRTFPTKSGNFKGTAKSAIKLSLDAAVPGADGVATLTAPIIAEVSFSLPVGVEAAEVLKLRQRLIALLDSDTVMDDLNIKQMV